MLSEDELGGVPLLVFCNKQDVDGALKPEEISEQLGLAGAETARQWSVRGSCATIGEGLEEGLDWSVILDLHPTLLISCGQAGECDPKEIEKLASSYVLTQLILTEYRYTPSVTKHAS